MAPTPIKPPSAKRGQDPYLTVELAPRLESDGTLPLRVAADAIDSCRDSWSAVCALHGELLAKVSPINPEPAAQLKSRKIAFERKQQSLKRCDAALAELRVATKETEAAITRKTVPPRMREDVVGALQAQEVRAWLRSHADRKRLGLVEKAIHAGDMKIVAAALELPAVAGLSAEQGLLLGGAWRRKAAPEELERLAVLERTAERVNNAAAALERRYSESYDHAFLDRLEPPAAA